MFGPSPHSVHMHLPYCSDRFRTAVNVFGDCVGCGIVDRYAPRFLPPVDKQTTTSGSSGGGAVGEETSLFNEEGEGEGEGEGEELRMEKSGDAGGMLRQQPEELVDGEPSSTLM